MNNNNTANESMYINNNLPDHRDYVQYEYTYTTIDTGILHLRQLIM